MIKGLLIRIKCFDSSIQTKIQSPQIVRANYPHPLRYKPHNKAEIDYPQNDKSVSCYKIRET